ncbi:MAG: ABC transporter permease [Bacteroidota bacterium]|nr:ABC transporter permease [Bacteroidota bacterium]MDX5429689.1 ABC transporter permease [Bacteroidota bacterium]MDX5468470.1 ABC transporter permease [Bacteroidota bacterium]
MKNIVLVSRREYLSRVKKKSFIIMTILGPLLVALFYGAIIWLAVSDTEDKEVQDILVIDESGVFDAGIEKAANLEFYVNPSDTAPEHYYGTLLIPSSFSLDHPEGARYISSTSLSLMEQRGMENQLEKSIKAQKLLRSGLKRETLDSLATEVTIISSKTDESGEKVDSSVVNAGAGMAGAFLIYLFIFLYGVQVMKGVAEEKSNRIVEVIISSVKPFDLMMGKILGIALVGLTQVFIWIALSGVLMMVATTMITTMPVNPQESVEMMQPGLANAGGNSATSSALSALFDLDFGHLIFTFLFYFITGYLLYSAMFAAIASAVDAETDTQQFMFPITVPLIFSIVVAQSVVIRDPNGTLATWLSMIPFTSPIVMMVRIPFGVETWQLVLSMLFMIFGFIGVTWMAARIYRVGILLYGKKPSYKELFKWLTYRG